MKLNERTLLIDADYLCFRTAAACQQVFRWDDDLITTHINLGDAQRVFADELHAITAATAVDILDDDPTARIVLCWSDPSRHYFRHDILPSYKGNRRGASPPLGVRELREWANGEWDNYFIRGLEGDDVLGLLATGYNILPREYGHLGNRVVVSADKDLNQIMGLHYNPMRPEDGTYEVTAPEGKRLLALQTLMGDSVDGYSGCPGIGVVKANRMLDGYAFDGTEEIWPMIVECYDKAGLTEADAVVQYNVARILQTPQYDFMIGKPKLWDPLAMFTSTTEKAA